MFHKIKPLFEQFISTLAGRIVTYSVAFLLAFLGSAATFGRGILHREIEKSSVVVELKKSDVEKRAQIDTAFTLLRTFIKASMNANPNLAREFDRIIAESDSISAEEARNEARINALLRGHRGI